MGEVCEAYDHSSYEGGTCVLLGPKMSESVPGLDGSWRYIEGNTNGGNTRITQGSGTPGVTCRVKGLPGQHDNLGAARRGGRANVCRVCGCHQAVGAGAGTGILTPHPLVLHVPPWCHRTTRNPGA